MLTAYELFLLYGLYNLANTCFLIILSNLHDIKQYKDSAWIKKPDETVFDRQKSPLFSIIMPAYNEEKVISRAIQSIVKLDYPNYEVIIVNDGSVDSTHLKSLEYLWHYFSHKEIGLAPEKHPRIKYLNSKKNVGKAKVLNYGLKHANGELVVCMDADAIFKQDSLKRAVEYFKDPTVSVLAVNNKLVSDKSTPLTILQHFDFIGNYRSKKAYDLLNAEYIVSGIGAMYRKDDLLAIGGFPVDTMTEDIDTSLMIVLLGSKDHRVRYAEDVVTYMEPVHSFKDLLKQRYRWKFGNMQALYKNRELIDQSKKHSGWLIWWRLPMAIISELTILIELMFFSFMFYISVVIGNGLFLIAAYIVATLLCCLTFLSDDSVSKNEKKTLAPYIPIMFFLSLIMNVIQLLAFIKSLRTLKKLWRRDSGYTWLPPEREGTNLT